MNGIQVAIVYNLFIFIFNLEITFKNSCWRKTNKIFFFLFECQVKLLALVFQH